MRREEWICWTLHKSDIDEAARRAGIDTSRFDDEDYKEIVRSFVKNPECVDGDWEIILTKAVRQVVDRLNTEGK